MCDKGRIADKPDIWLQEGEAEGKLPCGCRLIDEGGGAMLYMCPMHKGAEQIVAAVRGMSADLSEARALLEQAGG